MLGVTRKPRGASWHRIACYLRRVRRGNSGMPLFVVCDQWEASHLRFVCETSDVPIGFVLRPRLGEVTCARCQRHG